MKTLNEAKEITKKFIARVGKDLSDRFFALKNRLTAPENDVSHWMKRDPEELADILDELENIPTRKQKDEMAREGSKLIYTDEDWGVYEILNVAASVKYGKYTRWCISGEGGKSEEMWNFYKNFFGKDSADKTKMYFFISKQFSDKYAVLFNTEMNKYLIWNDVDNPVAFILEAPKVPGLPDLSVIPDKLKQELAAGLGIGTEDIVSVVNSYADLYPGGDNLEKYSIEYKDKDGIVVVQDLYRSPETNGFVPLEEELNNYF